MKALITGASSGIGREIAYVLASRGYDLILVARRKDKLEQLKKELDTHVTIFSMDISSTFNCMKLYNKVKNEDIDVLVNNAGFGMFGNFWDTNVDKELDMIDLNIKTVHVLTKLFLKDFREKNKGYILNVASFASFLSGPLMSSYYATKAYVLRFTEAIYEELRREHSDVYVGVLCPGPVDTEFNEIADVQFGLRSMSCQSVALYAVNHMFLRKFLIIPGSDMKILHFFIRFLPIKIQLMIAYSVQKKKKPFI